MNANKNARLHWCMLFLLLSPFVAVSPATAHSVGTSYVFVQEATNHADHDDHGDNGDQTALQARVDLNLRDLEFAVGLDADGDARITWAEVQSQSASLAAYVDSRLSISRSNQRCTLQTANLKIEQRSDGPYAALFMPLNCPASGALHVQSNLMFDVDDSHRTLLSVTSRSGAIENTAVTVLTNNSRTWTAAGISSSMLMNGRLPNLVRFITQGVWHIWTGYDHLAFLLLLILPLIRVYSTHLGATNTRTTLIQVLQVVTAFTVAHSITLACAAFNYVQLPSRFVEAAIAASIVIAAIANLLQRSPRFGIAMAFGFGLIHGLGFASALADIATDTSSRLLPLLGFNAGVEIGQLIVVAAVLPLLLLTRRSQQLNQRTAATGSVVIGMLGIAWLLQRIIS